MTYFLIAIAVASLLSRSLPLFIFGLIFVGLSGISAMAFVDSGALLYIVNSAFDGICALIAVLLYSSGLLDRHLKPLFIVMVFAIVNNALGLALWWLEFDQALFVILGHLVYSAIIAIMLRSGLSGSFNRLASIAERYGFYFGLRT